MMLSWRATPPAAPTLAALFLGLWERIANAQFCGEFNANETSGVTDATLPGAVENLFSCVDGEFVAGGMIHCSPMV